MKSRDEFVRRRNKAWGSLDLLLTRTKPFTGSELSRLSMLYREVSGDLMAARSAGFGPDLIAHLDGLAARSHTALYGHSRRRWQIGAEVLFRDFPGRLRENSPFVWGSAVLFLLPLAVGVAGALLSPHFAVAVLPPEQLEAMAETYSHSVSAGREAGTNAAMAGFYVMNNVGIAFRCFATGVLFGAGSTFFLVYNGLTIGTIVGHVIGSGHGTHILTFISGHAPFELGAVVVSGAAGLRLGTSLLKTGKLTRAASLRVAALGTVPLVVGATAMLLVAAVIEAFWSPSSVPYPVKWAFAVLSLLGVVLLAGLGLRPARKAAGPPHGGPVGARA